MASDVQDETANKNDGERIAKVMARHGLCSRRDAESWISEGRVKLNGTLLTTPAVKVTDKDRVEVDGFELPTKQSTRLWLYHKPAGLVTTAKDEKNRDTIFSKLPENLPRVISVGRLDINTEGLLLLTNDGGLSRVLELPKTGWLRRYRVRVFGKVNQEMLDVLKEGVVVDGVHYGSIEATLERSQGHNSWLMLDLREGKNREIKRVMEYLDLRVTRLIRISYGPFQLGDLERGHVKEVRARILKEQLGAKVIEEAGCYFANNVNIQKSTLGLRPKPLNNTKNNKLKNKDSFKSAKPQKWSKNSDYKDKNNERDGAKNKPQKRGKAQKQAGTNSFRRSK